MRATARDTHTITSRKLGIGQLAFVADTLASLEETLVFLAIIFSTVLARRTTDMRVLKILVLIIKKSVHLTTTGTLKIMYRVDMNGTFTGAVLDVSDSEKFPPTAEPSATINLIEDFDRSFLSVFVKSLPVSA